MGNALYLTGQIKGLVYMEASDLAKRVTQQRPDPACC